jgi:hypothetical protein
MDLKDFSLQHWWNVLAVAGGAVAIASTTKPFALDFLIGPGLVLFGVGEWINHPRQPQIKGAATVGIYKVSGYPWRPNVFGLLLDALGIGLFVLGQFALFQMAFAP